jgi:mRNA-degrading endonuclease toxin of MazEF toxin-antitoxin module
VRIPVAPGHAQAGDRPALILQNDPLITSLPTVFAIPFTSKPAAARFPCTLVVSPNGQNGLIVQSVALPPSPHNPLKQPRQPLAAFRVEPTDIRDAASQMRAEVGHAGAILVARTMAHAVIHDRL